MSRVPVDIRDDLDVVFQMYECAYMAATSLQAAGERQPICAVLDQANEKLAQVISRLSAFAESPGDPPRATTGRVTSRRVTSRGDRSEARS